MARRIEELITKRVDLANEIEEIKKDLNEARAELEAVDKELCSRLPEGKWTSYGSALYGILVKLTTYRDPQKSIVIRPCSSNMPDGVVIDALGGELIQDELYNSYRFCR